MEKTDTAQLVVDIVCLIAAKTTLTIGELVAAIPLANAFIEALLEDKHVAEVSTDDMASPAVPIDDSVTSDYIVCLEDGQRFKSLRMHLSLKHGMSPQSYREKWRLPANYPMIAANYSNFRSRQGRDLVKALTERVKKDELA